MTPILTYSILCPLATSPPSPYNCSSIYGSILSISSENIIGLAGHPYFTPSATGIGLADLPSRVTTVALTS